MNSSVTVDVKETPTSSRLEETVKEPVSSSQATSEFVPFRSRLGAAKTTFIGSKNAGITTQLTRAVDASTSPAAMATTTTSDLLKNATNDVED